MKTKNKKRFPFKKLIVPAIAVILIAGGVYVYASSNNSSGNTPKDTETTQPAPVNDPVPEGEVPTNATNKENLGNEPETNTDGPLVTITAASINGSMLQVRALIQGVVTDGTCDLSVTQNGVEILKKSAGVQAGPSTSTCQGFDVDISDIPNGDTSLVVTYNHSDTVSTSQTQTIQIQR